MSDPVSSPFSHEAIRIRAREWLSAHELKLVDVEERTGDSYQRVQRWLGGSVKIPVDFLARFVASFPVSAHWLLTGEGPEDRVEPAGAEKFVADVKELLEGLD